MPVEQPRTHRVRHGEFELHAVEHPGSGPTIVLMHGFPDDRHLYDRLVPLLAGAGRRVVTFDFLGWGDSDKPAGHRYTAAAQTRELAAVVDRLDLAPCVLVAHDASGPPAIDWALANPDRTAALVLLNTYYAWTLRLRRPPAIALYSTPVVRVLARAVMRRFDGLDRRLYHWQVGRFMTEQRDRDELLPQYYQRFRAARPAFWSLNDDLMGTVVSRLRELPRMAAFPRHVRIVFGADDPYLNARVARWFDARFGRSDLHLVPGARHYVQVDRPDRVAELVLGTPTGP